MSQTVFDELQEALNKGGVDAVLDRLIAELKAGKQYGELFEALKMKVRHRLGLPLLSQDLGDGLDDERRTQLEEGLISACHEVGMLLLREGRVREGWMYLRPVGNRREVADVLRDVEADEDNLEEMIEVTLHEGVDPPKGYQLVLDHYGTCNAITTYESVVNQLPPEDQQAAAGLLVRHLHGELLASVRADVAQQEGAEPAEQSLADLVADRDWLFGEHSYHVDTTHLASTVRFSRNLQDPELLKLALDLTAYGRRLNSQFQYQGDEPFGDLYPAHALFLDALLGNQVEDAVQYFRQKSDSLDPHETGTQPITTFIELLDRLGRYDEAIDALIDFANRFETDSQHVVPLMLDLCQKSGRYERLNQYCRQRGDLLGFASGLVQAVAS